MKRIVHGMSLMAAAAALAVATPAIAQEETDAAADGEAMGEMFGAILAEDDDFQQFVALFKPDPLTPEQEARLPLATQVVGAMMPDGTMAEMMTGVFRDIVDPLSALERDNKVGAASALLGYYVDEDAIDEAAASEIVAIIDPSRDAREAATMAAIEQGIADVMVVIEPAMREAMSKAFAANFETNELTDIGTFFATPSGAAFAAKSYKLASDPSMFIGMLENLPQMIGPIMMAFAEGEQAIEALPKAKTYADLDAADRARLTALSGLDEGQLEEAMIAAENLDTMDDAAEEAMDEGDAEWDS